MVSLPPLNLFSIQVKGTLSWEWLEEGMLIVKKSRLSWFIRPCAGTPSPCKPKGHISTAKLSQAEAAIASCLYLALPASGNASMKFSWLAKYTSSHSCGKRKGCQPFLAFLTFRFHKGIWAQYKSPHWLCFLSHLLNVLAALSCFSLPLACSSCSLHFWKACWKDSPALAGFFNRFATWQAGNSFVANNWWTSFPNSFAASVSFLAFSSSCSLCKLSSWMSLSLFLFIPSLSQSSYTLNMGQTSYTLNSNSTNQAVSWFQLGIDFRSQQR